MNLLGRTRVMVSRTRLRLGILGMPVALAILAGCGPRAKPPPVDLQTVLRVDQFNCLIDTDPKRVTIVGKVRNVGEQRVREALVVASLRSPSGRVKGIGQVIVSDIKPGEEKPFKIVSKYRYSAPKPKNIAISIHDPPPESRE